SPKAAIGFCFSDVGRGPGSLLPSYYSAEFPLPPDCARGAPFSPTVTIGLSAGWYDRYGSGLPFQWIDASNVIPGTYELHNTVDPDNVVEESSETDNSSQVSDVPVTVAGYRPRDGCIQVSSGPRSVVLPVDGSRS